MKPPLRDQAPVSVVRRRSHETSELFARLNHRWVLSQVNRFAAELIAARATLYVSELIAFAMLANSDDGSSIQTAAAS